MSCGIVWLLCGVLSDLCDRTVCVRAWVCPLLCTVRSAALEFLSSLTIEFLFCLTLSTEGVTASHGACDECHTPASSASMQPMFIEEGTTGFTIINNLGRILVRL